MFTANAGPVLTPEEVSELLVKPVMATAVSTLDGITTTAYPLDSGTLRMPSISDDPSAAWVDEGQEIPVSDADLEEIEVVPCKISGLTVVSSELLEDTNDEAAAVIGAGLVRDIARKLDTAFVGNLPDPAPEGLASLDYTEVAGDGGPLVNLDRFALAISTAEDMGALITSWITSPAMALRMARLPDEEGSNRRLLSVDPALPTRRMIEGRPVLTCPDVPANVVWGVPAFRVFTVVRTDADVVADSSAFFTSDRVAIRARMRVGFGFPHEESILRMQFPSS